MARYQFLFGLTVTIILSSKGCHSQQPGCGVALNNFRIVGGQAASPGSWPWLASLNDNRGPYCAGSLINKQWVMTAAHCMTGSHLSTVVYLGRYNQSGPNLNEVSRRINQVVCHPSHDFLTAENDICLLKLSAPVNFTVNILPVCLAAANSTFHAGLSSWVAGWGAQEEGRFTLSDIIREANVPIVGNKECKCKNDFMVTKNTICAGLKAGGRDACQGDSGAPLVTKDISKWVQCGIVSWADGCARPNTPAGYARVSEYQDWISSVVDGNDLPGFVTFISRGIDSDLNYTCPTRLPPKTSTTPRLSPRPTDEKGNSVFDGGENVSGFSHFTRLFSVCGLALSLRVLG